ncbi:hypothetical protein [Chryseobacterium sp. RU33C]|uniref:hypothetical protein n=1 Tax=Chryseobacterium sp. RU33C TaxID=1907398 RepID=UPI00095466CD|nr:hypothetical protein [Chryseobacterium sp. RU33C]SIQ98752.1 hypothetical protein SAMN05880573_113118 [Chryseobacterium sp. RU33C]
MLIISCGGNKELFQSAKHIISLAPNIPIWEFSHYKPAKVWDFSLSIKDTLGFGDSISVSNWEYVLLKFPDNTFDIIVKCPNITNLKDDDKYTLIDIVLENILGDEISYNFIKNVEIVNDFEDKYKNSKTSIVNLKEHFFLIL